MTCSCCSEDDGTDIAFATSWVLQSFTDMDYDSFTPADYDVE